MSAPESAAYARPRSLSEAISLAQHGATIIGGGTDIYPAHVGRPLPAALLDVSAVAEMRGIALAGEELRIGGAVTWAEIAAAALPASLDALKEAARQIGAVQVQNRGTIAGNLCNASPAADGLPPLLALDAEVELVSAAGGRRLPLEAFVTGYRRTAIRPGEVLAAVIVPRAGSGGRSAFEKLGARKYLVISIVMAAALVRLDRSGAIAEAAIAVGSASEKALRLRDLERDLAGVAAGDVRRHIASRHLAALAPIDDVRATALYRAEAAAEIVAAAVARAAEG